MCFGGLDKFMGALERLRRSVRRQVLPGGGAPASQNFPVGRMLHDLRVPIACQSRER